MPKGWPIEDRTLAGSAAQEAWEEAGVKGEATEAEIGVYLSEKARSRGRPPLTIAVHVFQMKVDSVEDDFPEAGQRKRAWMSPEDAAASVREKDLKSLLSKFRP